MKSCLCFIFFLLSAGYSYGQEKRISTIEVPNKDYYTSITYLSEGAINWSGDKQEEQTGTAFRVIILTSEIYDNLLIEKAVYGSEGGGKKVMNQRKIDLENFWTVFGLTGEITGISFLKWLTWDAFEIKIGNEKYLIKEIESQAVKVIRN